MCYISTHGDVLHRGLLCGWVDPLTIVKVGSVRVDGHVDRMLIGIVYSTTEGLVLRKQVDANQLVAFRVAR